MRVFNRISVRRENGATDKSPLYLRGGRCGEQHHKTECDGYTHTNILRLRLPTWQEEHLASSPVAQRQPRGRLEAAKLGALGVLPEIGAVHFDLLAHLMQA